MNANLERKYLYMELDRKEMGRRISKRRKALGIKQAVLAEKIGVNGNPPFECGNRESYAEFRAVCENL